MSNSIEIMLLGHLERTPWQDLLIRAAPGTGKTLAVRAAERWGNSHPTISIVSFSAYSTPFACMYDQLRRSVDQDQFTVFMIDDIHLLASDQLERIAQTSKYSPNLSVIGLGLPLHALADPPRSCGLFYLINEYRTSIGLPTQRRLPELDQLALGHTHYMARQLEMTHRNEHGMSPTDRVLQVLPEATHVRECVARGLGSPSAILEQWLGSRNHYNNIRMAETNACGLAQVWRWTVSADNHSPHVIAHVFATYIACSIGE